MRAHRTVGLVLVVLLAGACSAAPPDVAVSGSVPAATTTTPPATAAPDGSTTTIDATGPGASTTTTPAGTLDWQSCGRLECATLTVPLDYSDASKGTIDLSLKRRPAGGTNRIGSMLVNPGGPGVPGTTLVDQATLAFSEDLLDHFDIVGWDPRGTGDSSPIDCVDDLDPLFSLDPIPDTPAEKQILIDASKQFDAACEARSGELLPYVSTQDTARDMDEIRRALGEEKISYFGFSYGSQLGATYATMFPTHVRAMVIDGAADPNAGYAESTKQQVVGLERGLQQIMDDCAKKTTCAFHHDGNPMAAYDALIAKLTANPLPSSGGRPAIGPGIALYGVVSGLYVKEYWPIVTQALAAAERGDGSKLLALYDAYVERLPNGTWTNSFEDLIAINCLDDPGPKDPSFPDTYAAELRTLSPHFGDWAAYSYNCIYWPVPQKTPLKLTGAGAGPIVVVGTTGDPITPIESTRNMADALEGGVLVTVEAERHTGYMVNDCVDAAVDNYLVDLTTPAAGLVCS